MFSHADADDGIIRFSARGNLAVIAQFDGRTVLQTSCGNASAR
jgi:hypothetical protein